MSWFIDLIIDASRWMRGYIFEISMAIVATAIGMLSGSINRFFKRMLKSTNFPIRFGCYVLLMAFGYGLATVAIAKLLASFFRGMDNRSLAPVVILCFAGLALLAERNDQV